MKKVIEQFFCDDCGREVADSNNLTPVELVAMDVEICRACVQERIQHSQMTFPIGRQCPACKGSGNVKDFYGHNDYNWVKCSDCKGQGFLKLRVT